MLLILLGSPVFHLSTSTEKHTCSFQFLFLHSSYVKDGKVSNTVKYEELALTAVLHCRGKTEKGSRQMYT